MEKRKPKQADPIGENVQLDGAVMASTAPFSLWTNAWRPFLMCYLQLYQSFHNAARFFLSHHLA
jgi:hypothetical protein